MDASHGRRSDLCACVREPLTRFHHDTSFPTLSLSRQQLMQLDLAIIIGLKYRRFFSCRELQPLIAPMSVRERRIIRYMSSAILRVMPQVSAESRYRSTWGILTTFAVHLLLRLINCHAEVDGIVTSFVPLYTQHISNFQRSSSIFSACFTLRNNAFSHQRGARVRCLDYWWRSFWMLRPLPHERTESKGKTP